MSKKAFDQWTVVQRVDTGLVVGNIGPGKDHAVGFCFDGSTFIVSAKALREIADLVDLHGLELAS